MSREMANSVVLWHVCGSGFAQVVFMYAAMVLRHLVSVVGSPELGKGKI